MARTRTVVSSWRPTPAARCTDGFYRGSAQVSSRATGYGREEGTLAVVPRRLVRAGSHLTRFPQDTRDALATKDPEQQPWDTWDK